MTEQKMVETRPNQGTPQILRGDWAKQGITKGFEPSPSGLLRLMLVGPYGGGKSTFVMGRPRNLVLSFEYSAHMVPYPRAHRLHITSIPQLDEIWKLLKCDRDRKDRPFDCISFDVIDQFSDMLDEHMGILYTKKFHREDRPLANVSDFGEAGAGVAILRGEILKYLKTLTQWGYGWMVLSHVMDKMVRGANGGEYTTKKITAFPTLTGRLLGASDYCLMLDKEQEAVSEKKKVTSVIAGYGSFDQTLVETNMKDQYYLICSNQHLKEIKFRIEIKKKILLPDSNQSNTKRGWDVFSSAYDNACEKFRGKSIGK